MTKRKQATAGVDWPGARPPEMVKVASITPHPENPRTHPDAQIAALGETFDEFGVVWPIVLDENLRLMAGEGRWKTAKAKKFAEYPCIVIRGWSEKKKRRFMVADNRLPQLAGYDDGLYKAVLAQIKLEGGGLAALGLDDAVLAALLAEGGPTNPNGEWTGMPEFNQQDKTAFRSIVVHFKDQKALDAFLKVTKQKITPKTRYLWYPKIEIETLADKRYTATPATPK